ncbi:MAG: phage protein Gp27 family protein [Alphaproteobacteria bacterium]
MTQQTTPEMGGASKVQLTRMAETALGTRGPRSKLHRLLAQGHPALLVAVADIRAGKKRVRDILTELNKALEAAQAQDRPIAYQAFSRFARRLQQRQETLRQAGEEAQRLLGGFTKSITDVAQDEPRSDRDLLACEIIKTLLYDLLSAQAQSGELPSLDMLKHAASILNTVESAAQRAAARTVQEAEAPQEAEGLTHQTVEALRQHLFGTANAEPGGA